MTPEHVTREVIAGETPAITSWSTRHGWTTTIDVDALTLVATTTHPVSGEQVEVRAELTGYPARPPAWWFGAAARSVFPAPVTAGIPGLAGSIFHNLRVICAPWNRLAYGDHSGPHPDWQLNDWKSMSPESTRALTVADMLSAINLHLSNSPGMQAAA